MRTPGPVKKPGPPAFRDDTVKKGDGDEADLWHFVTSSVSRLKGGKGRVHQGGAASVPETPVPARVKAQVEKVEPVASSKLVRASVPIAPPPVPKHKPVPPLADFDRRKARKIRTGQVDIEARIDLHGMRQDEAHGALRSFLITNHARGKRWVLIITGKGLSLKDRDEHDDYMNRPTRGVLRQSVPRWLAEPELRAIVVSYTAAAIQHGGDGALYVHLRSKRA